MPLVLAPSSASLRVSWLRPSTARIHHRHAGQAAAQRLGRCPTGSARSRLSSALVAVLDLAVADGLSLLIARDDADRDVALLGKSSYAHGGRIVVARDQ